MRFEGPIRWDQEVSYGPAVIGTTDNKDQGHPELEGERRPDPARPRDPAGRGPLEVGRGDAADPADQCSRRHDRRQHPPRRPDRVLRRSLAVRSTTISGGRPPGRSRTASSSATARTTLVSRATGPSRSSLTGKTWRFLVLTHRGSGDRVEENVIEDIGFRDGDTIPSSNEPEIILTEAYHLTYEGQVAALSADGRLMRIHRPQGQEPATGDVVSLLTGPAAGQFRRIAQVDRSRDLPGGSPDSQGHRGRLDCARLRRRELPEEPDRHPGRPRSPPAWCWSATTSAPE